jgi:hypothetical protein
MDSLYEIFQFVEFDYLKGKTIIKIDKNEDEDGQDYIKFYISNGECFKMYHQQFCCESVYIEDIVGSLDDLLNTPILLAEVVTENSRNDDECESKTWTFYKLSTVKGHITIRWFGESNGYYSEEVDFAKCEP